MVRIVVDTNIIVSAYHFGGTPARVIDKAVTGEIELAISEPILDELWRVLSDKFKWPQESLRELELVISGYAKKVFPTQTVKVIKDDPPDNRILECAKEANADYLVTGDKDLLRVHQFGRTRILRPADFLRALEQQTGGRR